MVSHRLRGPVESTELARWNFGAFDRCGAILPFHYGPADGRNQPFRSPWIRRRAGYHPLPPISAPYRLDRRRTFPTVAPEFCSVRGAKPFTPCLEAYHLHRTRLELIPERKIRRRQLTDDGNVEITSRDLREREAPPASRRIGYRGLLDKGRATGSSRCRTAVSRSNQDCRPARRLGQSPRLDHYVARRQLPCRWLNLDSIQHARPRQPFVAHWCVAPTVEIVDGV
jgi:hypothetical protein